MAKVYYAAWEDKIIDNRDKRFFEIEEIPEFETLDYFDPGNSIKAFFGGKGFYVFDSKTNLLDSLIHYISRAASESCGKCTPCRVGLQIVKEKLISLKQCEQPDVILDELAHLSDQITHTSLCGLGQTATNSLTIVLNNFKNELKKYINAAEEWKPEHAVTYVTAPCIEACPSKVEVPEYIDYIKQGKFTHSVGVVLEKYPMAATCGRVCVRFCEMACKRTQVDDPVGIKVLKRFVADKEKYVTDQWFNQDIINEKKDKDLNIAVVGTGPAGISAAYHLLLKGYHVDVYEAMTEPGGMAAVGIPEYRLPKKDVLQKEVSIIESLGGKIIYNKRLGLDISLTELNNKYKAVFLGLGAHKGKKLNIPGENRSVQGYIAGVKFLLYINHYYIDLNLPVDLGDTMVVVGGGNVAMDCVRSALRLGVKEVHLIYRRTKKEMPADHEEIEAAEKEGVIFHYLSHPKRIITEGNKVTGIELIKMELGEPDSSGRQSVSPVDGSEIILKTDFVVPAIGQEVDLLFAEEDENVEINRWGLIKVDDNTLMTSKKGIFAGGDCVTGPATLIEAMSQGERAAQSIDDYLTYGKVKFKSDRRISQIIEQVDQLSKEPVNIPVKPQYKVEIPELDPEVRKKIFEEVEKPISIEEAYQEANRCMRCYRVYSVITEK
ncbi:MAG: FAD-dependent oxidoreductase [Spirochaetes bacterium]|nr:FAD-dependent oxidoreductase [Spirochaetota bacterium]